MCVSVCMCVRARVRACARVKTDPLLANPSPTEFLALPALARLGPPNVEAAIRLLTNALSY